jgi:ketosteroid isomerase-like protein
MTGKLMMSSGEMMPPTGNPMGGRFCLVLHFRDGKIDRSRGYFDVSAMR